MRVGAVNFLAGFWLWLYSNQLKRMPFVGNFSIAVLTALSVLIVAVFFRENNLLVYIFALFSFFITLIREIIKDMEDQKGDRDFGCRTVPIVWGLRKTKGLIYAILTVFIASVLTLLPFIGRPVLSYYFLLMLVPVLFFVYRLYYADTVRAYGFLSAFCKWVMLSGVLIMLVM
jgi:4-hydroxybenzoate polyprenyltransferase